VLAEFHYVLGISTSAIMRPTRHRVKGLRQKLDAGSAAPKMNEAE
jgi:hypothetical protein